MSAATKAGLVYLVGAGPGALGLVTLRAQELIRSADVGHLIISVIPTCSGGLPFTRNKSMPGNRVPSTRCRRTKSTLC